MSEIKPGLRNIRLDGLFGHLCASTGLYSRETFLSLYGCITRMVRDHGLAGFAMTRTLEDSGFETVAHALEGVSGLSLFRFHQPDLFPTEAGLPDRTGFLLVLTDRLCATLFWSEATHDTFRMYEGGWTFHPGDTRTIAAQLIARLDSPESAGSLVMHPQSSICGETGAFSADSDTAAWEPASATRAALEHLLKETTVDRRYDDKLNLLTTALVQGLENRNRELVVALDQLKILNKRNIDTERLAAIGQLSSVIAHEIRNPLGLIDLYAKLTEDQLSKLLDEASALRTSSNEEASSTAEDAFSERKALLLKNLALIRQATGSLETILSELTDYSRPLRLDLRPTDIQQLVADVCDFYQPSYQEKGVQLRIPSECIEGLGALAVDAEKIRQALINLLKNALEASPAGVAVTVQLACRANDSQVYIKVSDAGCGVAASHQTKLFTPYFSTKGNGTGLGLAHSRKILQAHGGNVELLSSTPGQGSTFALILPRTP